MLRNQQIAVAPCPDPVLFQQVTNLLAHGLDYARRLHAAWLGRTHIPYTPIIRDKPRQLARIGNALRRLHLLTLLLTGGLHCDPPAPRTPPRPDQNPDERPIRPPGRAGASIDPCPPAEDPPDPARPMRSPGLPNKPIGQIAAGIARTLGIRDHYDLWPQDLASIALTPAQYSAALRAEHPPADPPFPPLRRLPDMLAGIACFARLPSRPPPKPGPAPAPCPSG